MKKLMILSLILLAGCTVTKEIPIVTPVVCEGKPSIQGIKTLHVKFVKAQDVDGNYVIGLSGDAYENLGINSSRTLSYIKAQEEVVTYLESCIKRHNEKVE